MSRRRSAPPSAESLAGLAIASPLPIVRASISGGCTVTTVETAREAAWAALTFHAVHGLPVLIMCDAAAAEELATVRHLLPEELVIHSEAFPLTQRVRHHNAYHRTDAIAAKMQALKLTIGAWGDAVFFDADLTFFAALPAPQDNELMLSPNFEDFVTKGQHGLYNAGLVWSSRLDFAAWWQEEYTSGRSSFYEQSALDIAPSKWRASYYGPEHNHGFWRGPVGRRDAGSIHCHLSTALDHKMSPWALDRTLPLRVECRRRILTSDKLATLQSHYHAILS